MGKPSLERGTVESGEIQIEFEVGQFCKPSCDPTGRPRTMFGVPRVAYWSNEYVQKRKQGQIVQTNSIAVGHMRDARTQSSAKQKPNVSPQEKRKETAVSC